MARNKGIFSNLKGAVGPLSFYTLNGKEVVRIRAGHSSERIKTDPAFDRVKRNNQEFGGASVVCKAIRTGMGELEGFFKDSYMQARLNAACLQLLKAEAGVPGERPVRLRKYGSYLKGFSLKKKLPLRDVLNSVWKIEPTESRDALVVSMREFDNMLTGYSRRATHYRLVVLCVAVSDHNWDAEQKGYKPLHAAQNGIGSVLVTEPTLIEAKEGLDQVRLAVELDQPTEETTALVVFGGIVYLEAFNDELIPLPFCSTMECLGVY